MAVSGGAVEVERPICLRQMDMATDLHRTIAGVDDIHRESLRARD